MENMTEITRKMYESALRMQTVQDAANVLRQTGQFRTMGTVLRAFSGSENPKTMLVDGLMEWNPGAVRENVDKKVRNWLGGKNRSVSKKDAFILSRVLGLSRDRADEFLKMVTGEGIHWRDPEEIVWGYSIVRNLSPARTMELLDRVKAMGKPPKPGTSPESLSYTADVDDRLQPVLEGTEEELLAFLEMNWSQLGSLHNTAYALFTHFMELLEEGHGAEDLESKLEEMTREDRRKKEKDAQSRLETARAEAQKAGVAFKPDVPGAKLTIDDMDGDTRLYQPDAMTTREVLETYLYRRLVPVAERGAGEKAESFSAIQRSLRMNWPDEFSISKMRKRQLDVTRKVLILLFLATDGSETDYSDETKKKDQKQDETYDEYEDYEDYEEYEEEEELTPDQIFRNIRTRMDLMLQSCGFQKLDPRSPFDWMVLYCICIGDLWEADDRLQEMLKEMFPEEQEEDE